MAYRVDWTDSAWQEIEAAAKYIARDSPHFASALINVFSSRCPAVSPDDMKVLALVLLLLLPNFGKYEAAPDLAVDTGQAFQLINVESKSVCFHGGQIWNGASLPTGFRNLSNPQADVCAFLFHDQPFPAATVSEAEVYSDVEVSPDSRLIAFAAHSMTDNDSDVNGDGPAFANCSAWILPLVK